MEALMLGQRERVRVFAVEDSNSAEDLSGWTPVPVELFRPLGPRRFSYAPGLNAGLHASDVDVLAHHGLWRYTSIAARRWHAATGKPYVVSPHGMLDAWALQNSRSRKRIAAAAFENGHLRHASCIRALCASEVDAIRNYGLSNPIALIPNGVEIPPPAPSSHAPWDRIDGFQGAKILLSLGRLHPKKNLIGLVQAWKRLQKGDRAEASWRLVIAGWDEGDYARELRDCIDDLRLDRHVWLAGPLFGSVKEAAYRCAAAFVIPSLSEGLPMVVLEAWAHALPVVMTPECNLPEGMAAGAAIALGADPAAIAEGLQKLFGMTSDELQTMGAAGLRLVRERFTWSTVTTQMLEVYRWVIGNGLRPECVSG
jgi:glycosyltransferase involved in cell wall biosynthesis